MTAPSAPSAPSAAGRARRIGLWIGVAAVLGVIALLAGAPAGEGSPFDPKGTGPLGAKALVDLLGELGARVHSVDRPGGSDQTAIVLRDDLTAAQRDELHTWVAAGHILLVADPSSGLNTPRPAGEAGNLFGSVTLGRNHCDISALAALDRVDSGGGVLFRVPAGDLSCFGDGDRAFLVAHDEGRGTIVSVGGAGPFTNDQIGRVDNAALAAAVLAPTGRETVAVVRRSEVGAGDKTLGELVPGRVKQFLLELLVAFVLYALWRARRLGRPVPERQPVAIEGSELVVAVGHLRQRARMPKRAADVLRQDLRRDLILRYGGSFQIDASSLADLVAARTGLDPARLLAVLEPPPVMDDGSLVGLATAIAALRADLDQPARRA